jgi:hypothetical protein
MPTLKSVFGLLVVVKVALPQLSSADGTFQLMATAVSAMVLVTLIGQL